MSRILDISEMTAQAEQPVELLVQWLAAQQAYGFSRQREQYDGTPIASSTHMPTSPPLNGVTARSHFVD